MEAENKTATWPSATARQRPANMPDLLDATAIVVPDLVDDDVYERIVEGRGRGDEGALLHRVPEDGDLDRHRAPRAGPEHLTR